jgi:hypothetical protein
MKSIRRFVYAAALMLSALNFTPTLASAQDATGTFTLTHEVRWQNAIGPEPARRGLETERKLCQHNAASRVRRDTALCSARRTS